MSRTLALGLALVLAGCTANVPDGRFRCDADAQCPTGLRCRATEHLCYRDVTPGGDSGPPIDANVVDAGRDAGSDAGPCTASDCVTVTLTNAMGTAAAGMTVTVEGRGVDVPDYGGTTDTFEVSLGDGMLDIHSSAGDVRYNASGHASYALVVGHGTTVGNNTPVVRLLAPSTVPPGPHQFNVYPIDMIQDPETFALSDPMMPATARDISPGLPGDPGVLFMTMGQRYPLTLSRSMAGGSVMLAAFDMTDFPQTGSYFVALTGRTDAHLAADNGLRAIPIVPGMHLIESQPVAWLLNATDGTLIVCDGTVPITTLTSQTLSPPIAGFTIDTPAGEGRTLTFGDGRAVLDCSGTHHDIAIPYPRNPANPHPTGRVLLAVEGSLDFLWGGGSGIEGPPSTGTAEQVATYANGLFTGSMQFGSTTSPLQGIAPAISTVTLEWTTRQTDLKIVYGTGAAMMSRVFDWIPTASIALAFVTGDSGGNFVAYEMDAPFGRPWTLNTRMPH